MLEKFKSLFRRILASELSGAVTLKHMVARPINEGLDIAMSSGHSNNFCPGWTLLISVAEAIALVTADGREVFQVKPGSFQRRLHSNTLCTPGNFDLHYCFSQPPSHPICAGSCKPLNERHGVLVAGGLAFFQLIFCFLTFPQ